MEILGILVTLVMGVVMIFAGFMMFSFSFVFGNDKVEHSIGIGFIIAGVALSYYVYSEYITITIG